MLKQKDPTINNCKLMMQYVKEFETSNLTQSAFCKQHKISDSTFYRWKNKYAPALITTNKKNNKYTSSKKITNKQPSKISNLNFIEVPNDNINTSVVHIENLLEVFLCYK